MILGTERPRLASRVARLSSSRVSEPLKEHFDFLDAVGSGKRCPVSVQRAIKRLHASERKPRALRTAKLAEPELGWEGICRPSVAIRYSAHSIASDTLIPKPQCGRDANSERKDDQRDGGAALFCGPDSRQFLGLFEFVVRTRSASSYEARYRVYRYCSGTSILRSGRRRPPSTRAIDRPPQSGPVRMLD